MATQGRDPDLLKANEAAKAPVLSPQAQEAQRLLEQGYAQLDGLLELPPAQALQQADQALAIFKRVREIAQELSEDEGQFRLAARRALAETYSQHGHQQRYLNNHADAVVDLSQGLRLNPDRAEDYYYRGLSYQAKGDLTQARKDLTEYLRRGELDVLRDRAKAYITALVPGKDDNQASLAHWKTEGMRLNTEASNFVNPRGAEEQPNWAAAAKTYNQAIEAFNHALEASSKDGMTRIGLIAALKEQAVAYRQMGEYDLALENYKRAEQLWPNSVYSFLKGETLTEAGHTALARAAFEQYLAEGDDRTLIAQAQKYLAAKPPQARR